MDSGYDEKTGFLFLKYVYHVLKEADTCCTNF